MAKYKLKEGLFISPFGGNTRIDETNLTDEIAEYLIESGKASKEDFEKSKPELTDEEKAELKAKKEAEALAKKIANK